MATISVEYMAKAIDQYCESTFRGNCKTCPLKVLCDQCDGGFEDFPDICVEAYKIITGDTTVTVDNPVTHPPHYTKGGIECIDAMRSAFGDDALRAFCRCNAFKYLWRSEHKNGLEDIDKAIWYLNKYKELSVNE